MIREQQSAHQDANLLRRAKPLLTASCALLALATFGMAPGARAQGYYYSQPAMNSRGLPVPGAGVAVCSPLATTGAAVASNIATLAMTSNPAAAGFTAGGSVVVSGFSGADAYLNGTWSIAAVTTTGISFGLTHANASGTSNGQALQQGTSTSGCAPLATLYTDNTASIAGNNPFTTDGIGNLNFWATPGQYVAWIYGPTVTPTLLTISVPCVVGSICGMSSGFSSQTLADFSSAPTITPSVTGSTPYQYLITPMLGNLNESVYNMSVDAPSISNGYATLDGTHTNTIAWPTVAGATSYCVYGFNPVPSGGWLGCTTGNSFVDNGSQGAGYALDGGPFPLTNQAGYVGVATGLAVGPANPGTTTAVGPGVLSVNTTDVLANNGLSENPAFGATFTNTSPGPGNEYLAGQFTFNQTMPDSDGLFWGVYSRGNASNTTGTIGYLESIRGEDVLANLPAATVNYAIGVVGDMWFDGASGELSGTINHAIDFYADGPEGDGMPTNAGEVIGLYSPDQSTLLTAGHATHTYAIKIDNQTAASANAYAIYSASGRNYFGGLSTSLSTKSSAYTLTVSDAWVNVTGTTTITVPHAVVGSRWVVFNSGSNTVTVATDSGNINGTASITLSANTGKELTCDGSNCFAH